MKKFPTFPRNMKTFEVKIDCIPVAVKAIDSIAVRMLLSQYAVKRFDEQSIRRIAAKGRRRFDINEIAIIAKERLAAIANLRRQKRIREESFGKRGVRVGFWEQAVRDYERAMRS